jgi:hypothetical protein
VREGVRKRAPWGRPHPAKVRRVPHLRARHPGGRFRVKPLHACPKHDREGLLPEANQGLAVPRRLALLDCLSPQSKTRAQAVPPYRKPTPAYEPLLPGEGIGTMVAQTRGLDTGARGRLPTVGHAAASGRWVQRTPRSPGKRQGQGNVKHGTPYRAWAAREAAQWAIRGHPTGQCFAQRQHAQSPLRVARKAVAPTWSRACYDSLRARVPVDGHHAWGGGRACGGGGGETCLG